MTRRHDKSLSKPAISRYAFAMFDVLGFSKWVEFTELQVILDTYYDLIQRAVLKPNEQGSLSTVQTPCVFRRLSDTRSD